MLLANLLAKDGRRRALAGAGSTLIQSRAYPRTLIIAGLKADTLIYTGEAPTVS